VNRRQFLARLGIGSLAGSIPLLGGEAALAHLRSAGSDERHFRFVALSFGTGGDAMVMEGTGVFGAEGGFVVGDGDFQHITWPPPSTLLGHGLWKARAILSYETGFGSFGEIDAGILKLRIRMLPDADTGVDPFGARLTIACNIGPAGISTGLPEGFSLTLPGGATFSPAVPAVGLTHISTPH
jgi:hypothetical protein